MKRNMYIFVHLSLICCEKGDTDIEPEVIQQLITYNGKNIIRTRVNIRKQIALFVLAGMPVYTSGSISFAAGASFQLFAERFDIVSLWSGIPSNNPVYR